MIDYDLSGSPRGFESPEGHPKGVLDLCADDNSWPGRQREYKWPHHDGREHGSPRVQVVQNAEAFGAR